MTYKQMLKAIEKFNGWIEGDKIYFPTPHDLYLYNCYINLKKRKRK